ncbi:Uncharacterized protein SCF082_LOCUS30922, partial [Durusdinium trenchii]
QEVPGGRQRREQAPQGWVFRVETQIVVPLLRSAGGELRAGCRQVPAAAVPAVRRAAPARAATTRYLVGPDDLSQPVSRANTPTPPLHLGIIPSTDLSQRDMSLHTPVAREHFAATRLDRTAHVADGISPKNM